MGREFYPSNAHAAHCAHSSVVDARGSVDDPAFCFIHVLGLSTARTTQFHTKMVSLNGSESVLSFSFMW